MNEKLIQTKGWIKIQYVFKKLLVKTMIVFISIYFESYCKTLAWYNKKIMKSFYHKIHLHVKGILNQNKQPAHEDLGQCLKRHHHRNAKFSCCPAEQKQVKDKNLYMFFGGDVTICMYMGLCDFLSLIFGTKLKMCLDWILMGVFQWYIYEQQW